MLDSDGYSTWKCLMGVVLHLKSTCPSAQHKNFLIQSLNIYNDCCKTFHNIYIENKSVDPLSCFCFTHWNLRECLNLNISKTYKDKSLKSAPENTNKNFWNKHCRRGKFWIIHSRISQYCKIKHGEYVSMWNSQKSQTWKKKCLQISCRI